MSKKTPNQKKQRTQKKQRNIKRADECASALSENTKRRDIVVSRHAIHTCTFMQLQKLVSVHSSCRRMADAQQHARRIGKIRLLRQKWWAGHGKTESWTRRRQSHGHTQSETTGQVGRRLRCALPRHPCISGTKVCTTSLRAIFSAARCTLQCMRDNCMGCAREMGGVRSAFKPISDNLKARQSFSKTKKNPLQTK